MDVVVVYESLFGNTRLVAEAIADGIRAADPAARVSVTRTDATKLSEVDDACLRPARWRAHAQLIEGSCLMGATAIRGGAGEALR